MLAVRNDCVQEHHLLVARNALDYGLRVNFGASREQILVRCGVVHVELEHAAEQDPVVTGLKIVLHLLALDFLREHLVHDGFHDVFLVEARARHVRREPNECADPHLFKPVSQALNEGVLELGVIHVHGVGEQRVQEHPLIVSGLVQEIVLDQLSKDEGHKREEYCARLQVFISEDVERRSVNQFLHLGKPMKLVVKLLTADVGDGLIDDAAQLLLLLGCPKSDHSLELKRTAEGLEWLSNAAELLNPCIREVVSQSKQLLDFIAHDFSGSVLCI